jgi:primary-amine oxidase
MIEFLEKQHRKQPTGLAPTRCARVEVVIKGLSGNNELFDLLVDLDHDKVTAKQHQKGKHSYIDAAYMKEVEMACLANEEVQAEIRLLNLPPGASVVVEPWAYATDGMNDMSQRITMVKTYLLGSEPRADCVNSVGFISAWWPTKMQTTMHTPLTSAPRSRRS